MLTERQTQGSIPLPKRETERSTEKFLWGTFTRRERWGLSGRGWLLLGLLICGIVAAGFLCVEPFLAVTERTPTKILVVEGWVHDYVIRAGAAEFKNGGYERAFTTGGPVEGSGGYVNDYQTSASVGAARLGAAGVPSGVVQMVPSRVMSRNRTYASALALRDWLSAHNVAAHSFNVLTESTHARRTRLLFQKAFGNDVAVGIISVPNPDFDGSHWWRYSEGVRDVVDGAVAYGYARFLFYPSFPDSSEKKELQ